MFQWYKESEKGVGASFRLKNGYIYIMGDKAVGTHWKRKRKYTVRHAAGERIKLEQFEKRIRLYLSSNKG